MPFFRTLAATLVISTLASAGLAGVPQARAAAPNCTPDTFTGAADARWGGGAPVGISYTCAKSVFPGARLTVTGSHGGAGGGCTANFLFRGSNGRDYLGTAGHCTLAQSNVDGDRGEFYDEHLGAEVFDGSRRSIGRVEYAIQQGDFDFALIRLHVGVTYDTALPHWGRVTGINSATTSSPTLLQWVGHASGLGDVLYARSGYALGMPDPHQVRAVGLIAPGDSGGPVIDGAGKAIGVNVAVAASIGYPPGYNGAQVVTRLQPQLDRAAKVTGKRFTLLR